MSECENYYIYPDGGYFPIYSEESSERVKNAVEKIESEYSDYTTEEEFNAAHDFLYEVEEQAYFAPSELEWMIDYLAKDYNSVGYYDDETYSEIKTVYDEAKAAYDSQDPQSIHINYVKMFNLLYKICAYTVVAGDVDNSGELNIKDIALMQLELAQLNSQEFTSSQNFVSGLDHTSDITDVANWQLALAKLNDYEKFINAQQTYIDEIAEFEPLTYDIKWVSYDVQNLNPVLYVDRIVYWQ